LENPGFGESVRRELSPNPVKPEKDDGKIIRFDDCGLEPFAGKLQSAAYILEPSSGILQAIQ
jgi:hypothetical protein